MEEEKAFKNWINEEVVNKIAYEVAAVYPDFPVNKFVTVAGKLKPLELKGRTKAITDQLKLYLPSDYNRSLSILSKVIKRKNLKGFELWPFSEFISQNGTEELDRSIKVLYDLTQLFTSEFAIRPFIIEDHKAVLSYFKTWVNDENVHVRRWVSEGSRPILPWGEKLKIFIEKPELTIPLLDSLKFDEELYVRKSVANHLNDFSKFNPEILLETLAKWKISCPKQHQEKIDWIVRHSLRTLIKKGDSRALKLIGVSSRFLGRVSSPVLAKKTFRVGDKLEFNFVIESTSSKTQKVVIDYKVHFRKANGKIVPKVFKLKTLSIKPKEKVVIQKSHSLREVTTMKFYPGEHAFSVQVNGKSGEVVNWKLLK